MRSHELTTGRSFGLVFEHGDDFFDTLTAFCTANSVRQGYIPMFIAGFAEAEIVGTCEKLVDPGAPIWTKVHLTNIDALGCGTLAPDPETGRVLPHIHTSLGLKERSALGHTSHLLSARVQFLVEMVLVEITTPPCFAPENQDCMTYPCSGSIHDIRTLLLHASKRSLPVCFTYYLMPRPSARRFTRPLPESDDARWLHATQSWLNSPPLGEGRPTPGRRLSSARVLCRG